MNKLNDNTRDKLKAKIAQNRIDTMFGDGQEMEMIYEGRNIIGLNEMSDQELVEEYKYECSCYDEDELDELLINCEAELGIVEMLSSETT